MSTQHARYEKSVEPGVPLTATGLHLSSFVTAWESDSVLMLKCGDDHPLPFRRGKWVLPAVIINVGEHPDDAARRVMQNQLGAMGEELRLVQVQSHVGNHWDLCFIYQCGLPKSLNPPQIFTDRRFIEVSKLPADTATDHVDVIQQLKR